MIIGSIPMIDKLVNMVEQELTPSIETVQKVVDRIRTSTREYIVKNKMKALVIGLSGGLDSAVVAALLPEKETGIPLIGLSIPINSSVEHMEFADWCGSAYCTTYRVAPLWAGAWENMYERMNGVLPGGLGFDYEATARLRQGNLKARLRMITLYNVARATNGMVLSTDNYSELLAGFWTLHGDVGDYGVIQELFKGFEVPAVARYLGVHAGIIYQAPSDGLNVTDANTDEAQLGMTYKQFDAIMASLLNIASEDTCQFFRKYVMNVEAHPLALRALQIYTGTKFKREGTTNLKRELLLAK